MTALRNPRVLAVLAADLFRLLHAHVTIAGACVPVAGLALVTVGLAVVTGVAGFALLLASQRPGVRLA